MFGLLLLLLTSFFFRIVRVGFRFLQSILWRLNGIHAVKQKRTLNSVQLLDILWKHKIDAVAVPPSEAEFIATHAAFVSPEYVLQDHVTLYHVTPSSAIFVESDPNVDVSHSSTHFFMYAAQFLHARRVVIMPVPVLLQLADQMEDESAAMLVLSNTGRCGSTLFCQMFEQTGHSVCFSEQTFFNDLMMHRKHLTEKDFKDRMRACVRVLCKPRLKQEAKAYIIKPQAHNTALLPVIAELFPQAKLLFMYRDGVKVAKSYYEHVQRFKVGRLIMWMAQWSMKPLIAFVETQGVQVKPSMRKALTIQLAGTYLWADCCNKYLSFRDAGLAIGGVRHEDLVANRDGSVRAILAYCGLPEAWAAGAVRAMEQDSMKSLKSKQHALRSLQLDMKDVHVIYELFGIQHHSTVFPGTITGSQPA